jgi:hypothetical protein
MHPVPWRRHGSAITSFVEIVLALREALVRPLRQFSLCWRNPINDPVRPGCRRRRVRILTDQRQLFCALRYAAPCQWNPRAHTHTGRKLETAVTAVWTIPAAADWAVQEREGERLQLIQFEPKESKYTLAS